MHPWHEVDLGNGVPEIFPVIVKVLMGSKNKYELYKATGAIERYRQHRYALVNANRKEGA